MVKDINIHTTFEDKSHIFQCPQKEFVKKAAEYFNIAPEDMVLYAVQKGQKRKILCTEITDLMKVEIVNKNASSGKSNNQRTLRPYFSDQLPKQSENFDLIISKLQTNSPLTGIQRKKLSDWLEKFENIPAPLKRKLSEAEKIPQKLHKKVQTHVCLCQDGFSQTDIPEIAPPKNRLVEQKEIIAEMKKLSTQEHQNEKKISKLMTKSYEARRNDILINKLKVAVVKDKYPFLFSETQVMKELDRIFYPDKHKEFIMSIEKHSEAILEVDRLMNSFSRVPDEIVLKVKNALAVCRTPQQKKFITEIGSILLVPKLVKEPIGFINLADNRMQDTSISDYPYIDAGHMKINELFSMDELQVFKIIAEQQLLCEVYNLKDAVLCLLASFFIFNIHYPDNYYNTHVLFEKLYLLANDTEVVDNYTEQTIKLIKLTAEKQ